VHHHDFPGHRLVQAQLDRSLPLFEEIVVHEKLPASANPDRFRCGGTDRPRGAAGRENNDKTE